MKKILFSVLIFVSVFTVAGAQYTTLNAHSHNDYSNDIPFWLAYYSHFGSIEADIWAVNGELFVAHDKSQIKPELTLDALYINPIVKLFKRNKGIAWYDYQGTFQLLIDLKTLAEPTLSILAKKLGQYPDVFDLKVNPNGVKIVISGNRPDPTEFDSYPDFIYYDGLLNGKYDDQQLMSVPLFSENFAVFSKWRGEGEISAADKSRLKHVIDSVHILNKKIRFWNAPDGVNAWKTFERLGVDFLNTDRINELALFLNQGGK
jgi:alkaline phosphatase